MKNDKATIDFILDSVRKIEHSLSGVDKETFLNNQDKQSLAVLQLILIGELVKKITDDTKNKIDLPWKSISGFRDRAIHNYYDIKLDVVWDSIQNDLPELKAKLLEYNSKS